MTADSTPAPAGDRRVANAANDAPVPDAARPAKRRGLGFWLKWVAVGAAALVAAAFVGAYFLPREPEVTRSIDIAVPRATVFPLVADLRHLPDWLPLFAADPDVVITFTGPLDGVGQTLTWESAVPAVGSGVQKVTAIEPDSAVEMSVSRAGRQATAAWFRLTEKSVSQTTVVWGFRKDVGFNPVSRYRGLTLDGEVGPGYERGLERLKAIAEAQPKNG